MCTLNNQSESSYCFFLRLWYRDDEWQKFSKHLTHPKKLLETLMNSEFCTAILNFNSLLAKWFCSFQVLCMYSYSLIRPCHLKSWHINPIKERGYTYFLKLLFEEYILLCDLLESTNSTSIVKLPIAINPFAPWIPRM